jgi:hypothetical protein
MPALIDLTGRKFKSLTVLERVRCAGDVTWRCRCECGQIAIVKTTHLRQGWTGSCGCQKAAGLIEAARANEARHERRGVPRCVCPGRRHVRAARLCNAHRTLWDKYKLTPTAHAALWGRQLGCCAICRKSLGGLVKACVDHCHVTSRVRGILCSPCNLALGHIQDRAEWAVNATSYLLGDVPR